MDHYTLVHVVQLGLPRPTPSATDIAVGIERRPHMPSSVIGQIAADAHVKSLVLSHRMLPTLGNEDQTQSEIRKRYSGPLAFANDLDCFPVR